MRPESGVPVRLQNPGALVRIKIKKSFTLIGFQLWMMGLARKLRYRAIILEAMLVDNTTFYGSRPCLE